VLRAKTGTLPDRHVVALAGTVLDRDGAVVILVVLTNDGAWYTSARDAVDRIGAAVAGCGCRSAGSAAG